MRHDFYTDKPGQGCTVTAALAALAMHADLIIDAAEGRDMPTVLGLHHTDNYGLREWSGITSDQRPPLTHIAQPVTDTLTLVTGGEGPSTYIPAHIGATRTVIVDHGHIGRHHPLPNTGLYTRAWLVTRADYLALRHSTASPQRPDGIILLREPGRALTAHDIEAAIGAPIVATIDVSDQIARSVDAGLLTARPSAHRLDFTRLTRTEQPA